MRRENVQFVVISNPENRRVSMFQRALARLGLPQAIALAYTDILRDRDWLPEVIATLEPGAFVRIESPGENFDVTRSLMVRAAQARPAGAAGAGMWLSESAARALRYERGRIVAPAQQFFGYSAVLAELSTALAARPDIRVMNTPEAIVTSFDKAVCHRLLSDAGVRVPSALGSLGTVGGYDQLRARMHEHRVNRVFVKLRHGSSASGVVAYRVDASGEYATTSTVMAGRGAARKLFNSLKPRLYRRRRDIRTLIDALAREWVVVERWVDKAEVPGSATAGEEVERFDVRVVVIGGQARHTVMRCSRLPMTNLHLGNRRGSPETLVQALGVEGLRETRELAEQACQCIPGALYAGVDVMVEAGTMIPYIVEINAFGDLLPGLLDRGDDTYTAEIRAARDG